MSRRGVRKRIAEQPIQATQVRAIGGLSRGEQSTGRHVPRPSRIEARKMPKYESVFYEPNVTEHGLPRNPFKSCVVPRPIGWISTLNSEGVANLAPYAYPAIYE
jgi:hypothetical protein